ncbi:DUF6542 domain-containing protein [Modestobacter italicus]|uniref:DUF6542 domain-containing protein n=1 Tax=Modestobacter italicus (strain DSM 44449 / CECT 9708 / BC 501) TaxID=2732864 RepID=UPI001C93904D|nr:DUF6542 domain-containing protein [Modestobacter italicus]
MRAEPSDAGRAPGRAYPSPRAASSPSRSRADRDRLLQDRDRRTPDRRSPAPRESARVGRHSGEFRRPVPPPAREARADRHTGSSAARSIPAAGPRVPGVIAVLGVFLITLVAAAADSYVGIGLGIITLVALTGSTVLAAVVTRRRDLLTVVVAPPLVFCAVALANIGLAPSATMNLPSLVTLLVRGFPAMAIATGAALVLTLIRLAARR